MRRAATIRSGSVDGHEREGALQLGDDRAHGGDEVLSALDLRAEQVGRDLRVGLGGELDAAELTAELVVVLDDPVVHDRDASGDVRVGVLVRGRAVGGPAGVADGHGGVGEGALRDLTFKVCDLACAFAPFDGPLAGDCHPRGVISAVLKSTQAVQHHVESVTFSDVSNDSTHGEKCT